MMPDASITLIVSRLLAKLRRLEDGSYHVGMLHAPFRVELTLTVAKDG